MKQVIVIAVLLLLPISYLIAAEQAADKISLRLSGTETAEALRQLSETAHISILADSGVKGNIVCTLNDVTLDQAMNAVCSTNKWEWVKVQVSADMEDKPTAAKLFALVETVKQLGTSSIICDNPKTKARTAFIPSGNTDTDTSALTSSLKLKTYYLIRVIPDPVKAVEAAKVDNKNQITPQVDVRTAASQVWNIVGQMSFDQQMQVMRELRQQSYNSMTPEQRNAMRGNFGRGGGGNQNHQNHNQGGQAPRQ